MEDLPLKAVGTQREALEDVLKSVSPDSLEQAARTLASARLIDLYSVENSCAPASDLLTKLTYLGLRCRFCTDAYLQQISAAHLGKGDVAVAFSRSGRSVDMLYMGIILSDYERFSRNLDRSGQVIADRGYAQT